MFVLATAKKKKKNKLAKYLNVFNEYIYQRHGTSRRVKIPRVSAEGRLLQVAEQPSVNSGVLSLNLDSEIIEHFIHE